MKLNNWFVSKRTWIFLLYFSSLSLIHYCLSRTLVGYNVYSGLISTSKLFVLNMDKCKDRMRYIIELLDEDGIQCERISAIDGNALSFYDTIAKQDLGVSEVCRNRILKNKRL